LVSTVLRLKVRIERIDSGAHIEVIGIANSGFVGAEPEILMPSHIARELELHKVQKPKVHVKITGDGREVTLMKYRKSVKVYVLTEDRVEGPVMCSVLTLPTARYVLLNDKLLSKLKVVLLDFGEGIWCFRDELGRKERKSL